MNTHPFCPRHGIARAWICLLLYAVSCAQPDSDEGWAAGLPADLQYPTADAQGSAANAAGANAGGSSANVGGAVGGAVGTDNSNGTTTAATTTVGGTTTAGGTTATTASTGTATTGSTSTTTTTTTTTTTSAANFAAQGFFLRPYYTTSAVQPPSASIVAGTTVIAGQSNTTVPKYWAFDRGWFSLNGQVCLTLTSALTLQLRPCSKSNLAQQWTLEIGGFNSSFHSLAEGQSATDTPYTLRTASDGTTLLGLQSPTTNQSWALPNTNVGATGSQVFYRGDATKCLADVSGTLRVMACSANDTSERWSTKFGGTLQAGTGRCFICDGANKAVYAGDCSSPPSGTAAVIMGAPAGLTCRYNSVIYVPSLQNNDIVLQPMVGQPGAWQNVDYWTYGEPGFVAN